MKSHVIRHYNLGKLVANASAHSEVEHRMDNNLEITTSLEEQVKTLEKRIEKLEEFLFEHTNSWHCSGCD